MRLTYLRAGSVLLAGAALLLASVPLAAGVFDAVEPFDITDPDSEAQRAVSAYGEIAGERPEPEIALLVEPQGAAAGGLRAAIGTARERLRKVDGIASTTPPRSDPRLISADGGAALLLARVDAAVEHPSEVGKRVAEEFEGEPGLTAGGTAVAAHEVSRQSRHDARTIELYAAPLLLILSLVIFRGPIAAALPLLVGAFSIVVTLALLRLVAAFAEVDLFALQVVTGLGAGLAIDYSLLVLTRFRAELAAGESYTTAHARAVTRSGRTVAFSSLTVTAALASLLVFPQSFLFSTGIGGALVAAVSGLAAGFLLPAALALLGPSVGIPKRPPASAAWNGEAPFWDRLARWGMRRPLPVATLGIGVMLAISGPAVDGKLVSSGPESLPAEEGAKRVLAAVEDRFPELPATRLTALVPPGPAVAPALATAREGLAGYPAISAVHPPRRLGDGFRSVAIESAASPLSDDAEGIVSAARSASWPAGTLISGRAAEQVDQRSSIGEHAPAAVAIVLVATILMVFALLRSYVLPWFALLLNVLTVGASYGLVVAIFGSELFGELLGFEPQAGIDVSVPVLTFAVVFGLSTDYGIFVFAAIAEARARGRSDEDAIATGLARSGRVVSAAAALFSVAIGVFVVSDLVIIKEFAVAIALAVIIDATLVRGLIVPAGLKLLGEAAWRGSIKARPASVYAEGDLIGDRSR